MTARLLLTPFVVFVSASALRAETSIDVRNGLVDVHAAAAPITEVLEQLGEKTAIHMAFSRRPTAIITVDLQGVPPRLAVEEVLRRMDRGFGYALGLSPDRTRVVAVIVTAPGRAVAAPPDPFEPPPGKGEALEVVTETWQLEAQREAARLAPAPPPQPEFHRAAPPPGDPNEPTFGYGIDPFTPPEGRGDRLEAVLSNDRR